MARKFRAPFKGPKNIPFRQMFCKTTLIMSLIVIIILFAFGLSLYAEEEWKDWTSSPTNVRHFQKPIAPRPQINAYMQMGNAQKQMVQWRMQSRQSMTSFQKRREPRRQILLPPPPHLRRRPQRQQPHRLQLPQQLLPNSRSCIFFEL